MEFIGLAREDMRAGYDGIDTRHGRRRIGTFGFDGNNATLNVESDLPVEVNAVAAKSALKCGD